MKLPTKIETGGPAFPVTREPGLPDSEGMTLRDWFAGQALAGYMGNENYVREAAARIAYQMADAMLNARKEPTK